ncbi:MAG: response regulator [Bacteroidota bacterium]
MGYDYKILFVEDNKNDAELIWREIKKSGISFGKKLVDNGKDYLDCLKTFNPDIILSDYSLPQFNGMEALKLRNQHLPSTPFILVTGSVNEEIAVECMKAGADDYILKNNMSRLGSALINALNKKQLLREKQEADNALSYANERLKSIVRVAPVGIGIVNDRIIRDVNEQVCIMTGYSYDELVGKDSRFLYPTTEDYEYVGSEKYRQIRETGKGTVESRWVRKDGRIINVLLSSTYLFPEDKEKGTIFTALDITEKTESVGRVHRERAMLRTLIDHLPDAIYVKDAECRKIIANTADIENIGISSEAESLGKTDLELFAGEIGERGLADDLEVINNNNAIINREEDFFDKTGRRKWLLTSKLPLHDNSGKVIGLVGIGRDITARKVNEEELIRAKEKAEESDRLKTAFLHNISHEIRTPMNAIVGFSNLLADTEVEPQTQKTYIEIIIQSSNHLLAIISDIVDISNIEANLVKAVIEKVNINKVLASVYDQLANKAKAKNISLTVIKELDDYRAETLTDKTKLTQILINLTGNAIKFTERGRVTIKYSITEGVVEFSVSDTGIGIPEDQHEKIFNRFYQVRVSKSKLYEGTGLGLAISKAYIELLGGKISVISSPDRGTTFIFTIPYKHEKGVDEKISEMPESVAYAFKTKKKIIVAEDIESNFQLIRYFLKGLNAEVIRAMNGKEAVDRCLSDDSIDLILMDIKMPVMDGYTATRIIRKSGKKLPIIAQTAYSDDKENALNAGCSGFISKPFDKFGLLRVIKNFI